MSRPGQARAKADCFEAHKWADEGGTIYLTCCECGAPINPAREKWVAEHRIRYALTQDHSTDNVWPCHESCHKPKTAQDISENAKGKRVRAKHFGLVQKRPWGGKFRKKMNGEIVER